MSEIKNRISLLRENMIKKGIDVTIIPSGDPHQNEYLPEKYKGREWISGFTGSAGTVVISVKEGYLWTDGRYFLQAENQLQGSGLFLKKLEVQGAPEYLDWIVSNHSQGSKVAVDGNSISVESEEKMRLFLEKNQLKLIVDEDPLGEIWNERPSDLLKPIFEVPIEYCGLSRKEKIENLRNEFLELKVDHFLISAVDDIAWLLNLRGHDIECNPVFLAYVLIGHLSLTLYVEESKLSNELKQMLASEQIDIKPYDQIGLDLALIKKGESILINGSSLSVNLKRKISCDDIVNSHSPIMVSKSKKNEVEIAQTRKAMEYDGVALVKTIRFLEDAFSNNIKVTEYSLAMQLKHFRSEMPGYYGESFDAIIGYASNGAVIHYKPEENAALEIKNEGILLMDSGGQYFSGTTDVTRTFTLAKPSEEQKTIYTLVLKGHLAVSTAVFPKGTKGIQIDILARQYLWSKFLNYGHGTGHGVGYFLNVHEPPQGITNVLSERGVTAIEEGTITSNEPGFYKSGEYGIRIENLVLCKIASKSSSYGTFYDFETLTLFPYEIDLIDSKMLTQDEKNWINSYHQMIINRLSPYLNKTEVQWLVQKAPMIL